MTMYEALLGEISMIRAERDSLPSDTHVGALFDLTITRLREQAEPFNGFRRGPDGIVLPFVEVSDAPHRMLPMAS
jgi:hypothetical protein